MFTAFQYSSEMSWLEILEVSAAEQEAITRKVKEQISLVLKKKKIKYTDLTHKGERTIRRTGSYNGI
jgi:hypothetical protein